MPFTWTSTDALPEFASTTRNEGSHFSPLPTEIAGCVWKKEGEAGLNCRRLHYFVFVFKIGDRGKIAMPSYTSLRSNAQSVKNNSDDYALRKLADTVSELTRKVKNLEAEVDRIKSQIR